MKIEKYEYTKKNTYNIYLSNGEVITLNEKVITNNELLLKKEIDNNLYDKLMYENSICEAEEKAIKYISIRLRSIKEIKDYLVKNNYPKEVIDKAVDNLIKNKYLDDNVFTKAYIKDKLSFTTKGDYKIKMELINLGIEQSIIEENMSLIDDEIITNKIKKIIDKDIRTNKKYNGQELRNKIYNHLVTQGYSKEKVINIINTYNF